jgi:outer membrane lipoprotein-sorting protein
MLALALTLALSTPPADAFDVAAGYVAQMVAADAASRDVTMVMHKRERVGGKLRALEKMRVKYARPHAVYAKWIGDAHKGREVLWKKGWNKGELRARNGLFVLNLNPTGGIAMLGQRHPIMNLGFAYTIKRIAEDTQRMLKRADRKGRYELLGEREVHGARAVCWSAALPRDEDASYYGDASEICMDLKSKMPVLVKIWVKEKGELTLAESYSYSDVRVNVGLTDDDFDPENPDYNF